MTDYNECEECEITYSDDTVTETPTESKWALKGRFKSWALWTAIAGLISVILTTLGVWEKLGITSEAFDVVVASIGSILTAFGIVNNPTDGEAF